MRVFVCSPLRGKDGQPSQENIALARRLMRAVFDAGHQPFTPHLLYPQVLTENPDDLKKAFDANFAWLDVSDEIWVYARKLEDCSSGMRAEITYAQSETSRTNYDWRPAVVWMPPPFEKVEKTLATRFDAAKTPNYGVCWHCKKLDALNSQGICLQCFAGGTPA